MDEKFIEKIKDDSRIESIVILTRFGSHLYGTNTENSDSDYKGIFIPKIDNILLGDVPKSINFNTNNSNKKNSNEDIDCELYSINYWMKLAAEGETFAIDMLHTNTENTIFKSEIWDLIKENRKLFYSKNMKAFVGYAKSQAAKYGLKGSRLASSKKLKIFLEALDPQEKLMHYWELIPIDENITKNTVDKNNLRLLIFCGKQLQETARIGYAINCVDNFIQKFGERAKLAEENSAVDWKAMSHALRASFQLEEIFSTKNLNFPLRSADFLKEVKSGKIDFKTVISILEKKIEQLGEMSKTLVDFPDVVDNQKIQELLLKILKKNIYF